MPMTKMRLAKMISRKMMKSSRLLTSATRCVSLNESSHKIVNFTKIYSKRKTSAVYLFGKNLFPLRSRQTMCTKLSMTTP